MTSSPHTRCVRGAGNSSVYGRNQVHIESPGPFMGLAVRRTGAAKARVGVPHRSTACRTR